MTEECAAGSQEVEAPLVFWSTCVFYRAGLCEVLVVHVDVIVSGCARSSTAVKLSTKMMTLYCYRLVQRVQIQQTTWLLGGQVGVDAILWLARWCENKERL